MTRADETQLDELSAASIADDRVAKRKWKFCKATPWSAR